MKQPRNAVDSVTGGSTWPGRSLALVTTPGPPRATNDGPTNPPPLTVAASLVAVEGLVLVLLALLEVGTLSLGRLTMGLTTALFFAVYGAGLLLCAWQLTRRASWARSPVVLAQLIQLGIAWSFRSGGTTWLAVVLAVVALVAAAGVLHPDSIDALADDPRDG